MRPVSSWGRLSAHPHQLTTLHDPAHVAATISSAKPGVAYGLGRSYGDVCLNPGGPLWQTTGLDHFISFDPTSGRLRCEAGVSLGEIQRLAIPQGWSLAVTPGTQFVTVGGAIANDVHGKSHHRTGAFGNHVLGLTLARTTGDVISCGPDLEPEWFAATVGGLGLTGVIIDAEIQLQRTSGPWLETQTLAYGALDDFFHLAAESEKTWEHTVSWIDCLSGSGRGLFLRGNPVDVATRSEPKERNLTVPVIAPVSLVNGLTLRPFNQTYYWWKKRRPGRVQTHYKSFFYPLDSILEWNRIYGPRGFFQYQSVIPLADGQAATQSMLTEIARSGLGSFLAVLKTFGSRKSLGMLSFPRPGVTLALDFPNKSARTEALFMRLDAIVRAAGGSLYPAKDARMPRELFEAGFPRLHEFLNYRDPGISSGLSRRLLGS